MLQAKHEFLELKLVAAAWDSLGTHRRGTSAVRSHYQATAIEDVPVNTRICETVNSEVYSCAVCKKEYNKSDHQSKSRLQAHPYTRQYDEIERKHLE
jgi:hypothetical protein